VNATSASQIIAYFSIEIGLEACHLQRRLGNAGTYQGTTYYFASKADRSEFDKNQLKYVPQYDGFCANGVKNAKLTDVDPTMFFTANGKLYVCESSTAMQDFRAHEDEDITANRNWEQRNH
jgi:hypothetical protein